MSHWTPLIDEDWPTQDHQLVLRAALLGPEEAEAAWSQWLATNDIEDVDLATYFLFPTLYHNLKRVGIEGPIVTKLSGVYRFTWVKNLVAQQSLAEVVRVLDAEAIPVVALKGAALLGRHYTDPGARMMNDIDVLVREADALRSLDALQASGWTPDMPVPSSTHLAFTHAQADGAQLHAALMASHVICSPRAGGIRLSPHFYTPQSVLEEVIGIIRRNIQIIMNNE